MDVGDSATIGVENADGSDGLQVAFNSAYAEDGLAIAIQDVPTYLTLSPTAATVGSGSTQDFTVDFDATGLAQGLYSYTLAGEASNASSTASLAIRTGLEVTGAPFPLELSISEINESLNADESVTRTLTITNPTQREEGFSLELRGMSGIAPTWQPRLKADELLKYERMAESLKELAGTSEASMGVANSSDGSGLDFLPEPMAELNLDAYSTSVFGDLSGQFVRFDLGEPESLFALDASPTAFAGDFAVGQQDRFYVITADDNAFHSITTGGGITTFGVSEPQSAAESWTDLASNPVDGTLYASTSTGSASFIYTIDPTDGTATRVAQVAGAPIIISLAIDEFGQMYGLEIVNDELFEIDKDTGASTALGSVGFDANFAQGMDYDLATGRLYMAAYNNAGDGRGELRIADTETGATTLVGLLGDGDELGYLALNSVGFVQPNLLSGTIAPLNSVDVELLITAEGLYDGTYTGELAVISDAVGNPEEEVRVMLDVDADGELTVDVDELAFDALFIGNDQTLSALVSNTGRDEIELTLSIDNGDFTLDATSITLPAGVSQEVPVTFAPTTVGPISGTLTIAGAPNGTQTVALSGEGVPAPAVELEPTAFDLQAYPGQQYTRTLTMTNTGGSPLTFTSSESVISQPSNQAPDAVFQEVILEEDFEDGIPSTWEVVDNAGTGVIWQLNTDYNRANFAGSGNSAAADSDASGFVPYDTELISPEFDVGTGDPVLEFLVNFQAFLPDNDQFFDVDVSTDGGTTWTNALRLDDDTPPGATLVPNSGVLQSIPLASFIGDADTYQVRFRYYTTSDGFDWYAQIDDVQILEAFEYVTYEPASGTVEPGESLELTYSIDASNLPGGTYELAYTFETNAPETPSATIPFTLNVIESLAVTPDPQVGDDGIVHPNETFTVPVNVQSLDDLAVSAYELTLAFDGSVIEPLSVETDGTLSDGLVLASNLGDDTVQVAAAEGAMSASEGATPVLFDIEGEGTLVNVTFRAKEVLDVTDVTVSEIIFNEGQPAATGGSATVEVGPLYGDASLNVMVNGQDAALVLQHAAGIVTLDGAAFTSGNVSGDETLGAFDAALILAFSSEMIPCFPVEEGCDASLALASKSGGAASTLAWGTPVMETAKSAESAQALELPLTLNGSEPVHAFQMKTSLDAALAVDAVESALPDGWSLMHKIGDDGSVVIAAAGTQPLRAGKVATLRMTWTAPDGTLELAGTAQVNEDAAKAMANAELSPRPDEFALRGNYPNPFGRVTKIAMDLPDDARVDVEVYDLLGRRVQTMRGKELAAGMDRTIQVDGSRLSSGVYFYRVTVQMGDDRQIDTGRMTVVR
jgi:hypothetical protein